jgi:type IV pilus assembly protein PilQ
MKMNWPALGFRCLLLAGAAVAVLPAGAQVATGTGASISAVEVAQPGQQTTVRISGTGDLHYRTSQLVSPPRLVLDFADTRMKVEKTKVSSEFAPVLDVRVGQPNPGDARIVIDLAKAGEYKAQANGSEVIVTFPAADDSQAAAPIHSARKAEQRKLAAAATAPNMPLPQWLTGKDAGFARPATEPIAPVASPEPQNAPAADSGMQGTGATPAAEKRYTGDPISVNLKDVDLKDFFRLIHEISGLNVVLDPSVRGTVTLVLDEVPWDQALDIVLRNNGLTKEIDGNVLRIATQDTLKRCAAR